MGLIHRSRCQPGRAPPTAADAPHPGRPRTHGREVREQILAATRTPPANATHWRRARLAKRVGVSPSTVGRVWAEGHLKPHRSETFKYSYSATARPVLPGSPCNPCRSPRSGARPKGRGCTTGCTTTAHRSLGSVARKCWGYSSRSWPRTLRPWLPTSGGAFGLGVVACRSASTPLQLRHYPQAGIAAPLRLRGGRAGRALGFGRTSVPSDLPA